MVSSPGESHPQALSEPDLNLSTHPAPIIQPSAESPFACDGDSTFCIIQTALFRPLAPPTHNAWLTIFQNWMTQPLCSTSITEASTLLRAVPPLYAASVLSSLWVFHLDFSLYIGVVGSHVPHKSLHQVHAAFMPATAWTISRLPPGLSQVNDSPLVLMTSLRFRHFISDSRVFVSMVHT